MPTVSFSIRAAFDYHRLIIGRIEMAMMGKAAGLPPYKKVQQGVSAMPIHRLVRNHAFGPDAIALMVTAFEDALREMQIADRADPAAELIAKKIIEFAQQGERDPNRLRDRALQFLAANKPPRLPGSDKNQERDPS